MNFAISKPAPAGSSPRRTITTCRDGTITTYWPRLPWAEKVSGGTPVDEFINQNDKP